MTSSESQLELVTSSSSAAAAQLNLANVFIKSAHNNNAPHTVTRHKLNFDATLALLLICQDTPEVQRCNCRIITFAGLQTEKASLWRASWSASCQRRAGRSPELSSRERKWKVVELSRSNGQIRRREQLSFLFLFSFGQTIGQPVDQIPAGGKWLEFGLRFGG